MAESQSSPEQMPAPGHLARGVFVGRQQELTFLQQQVDDAFCGEGSLVFITGEAGIGKTRLAWEVRPYARSRGFLWLEGHYLRDEAIPFQAWVEAIRASLRTAPPGIVEKALQPYAAVLARLVPEVTERLKEASSLPALGPDEERLRLFEALAGFFMGIAREQPLALFLDDLQWASSIDALPCLARGVATERLLVLGTYREAELDEKPALARTLLALNRERLFYSLPLERLKRTEVVHMVSQTMGEETSAKLAETVFEKTEGNPFFVEEVLHYLTQSGAVALGEMGWEVKDITLVQLPRSVKAVVGERLERLGEEAQDALAWAAVVGQEFTFPLLKEVAGLEEEKLLEVVDKAVETRALVPIPSLRQEAYAFADEVVRDVLYERIGPARRRRYHLKVGQGMEKVHARRLEEHYDALARHFLEGNDLEKAAGYALQAGDRATSVYSWERAIVQYKTALDLMEELESGPRQQADVLEKLAQVTLLGRGRGALGYWEKALSIYEDLSDSKKAGEVHLQLGKRAGVILDTERRYSHNVKAVALLEPEGESRQLAQAYVQFGDNAVHGYGDRSSGLPLMEKGLALAERLGDTAGVIEAARWLGHALVYHTGEIQQGLALYQRCYQEARKMGNVVTLSEAAIDLSREYSPLRDAEEALRWAEQAVEASKKAGTVRQQIASALALAWACILQGDAPRACLSLETAEQMARKAGVEIGSTYLGSGGLASVSGRVKIFVGEWTKAQTELLRLLAVSEQTNRLPEKQLWANPAIGWLCLEMGDLAGAKMHLEEAATYCHAVGDNPPELYARALLTRVCSQSGDLEEAAKHLGRAREILSLSTDWLGLAAEVRLAEGTLATAEQRWPEAEAAFQQAVAINRQYHLLYYEAASLLECGQMYLSRNGLGDRERGMALLDQALAIFQRIQARKMVEKVASLLEQIEVLPNVAPAYPDGLTRREVEVLCLIAAGRRNPEIAAELVISLNTVTRHVSNIFSKTGAANRAEAATYAYRHGLVQ
jgi:DNA-binding CsgD family transcriptional regulator